MLAILAKLSNLHIEIKRSEIFSGKKKLQKMQFFLTNSLKIAVT